NTAMKIRTQFILSILCFPLNLLFAQSLTDTLDGNFDLSQIMASRYGFIAIPFIITEPAVGYGGGAALVFLHKTPEDLAKMEKKTPDLSGVFGMYTESNSWAVGAGHMGFWNDGAIRFRGGAGYLSLNLKYYPELINENSDTELKFGLDGYIIYAETVFRLFDSDFYAGGNYVFSNNKVKFDAPEKVPESIPTEFEKNIGGLGGIINYDSRDNIFTPNNGMSAAVQMVFFDNIFGSEETFQRLFSHWLGFLMLSKNINAGLRLDYQNSFGDMPFYLRPYISLRGIPAMRYQGKSTYLIETEARWDWNLRWSLVGFTGYGEAQPINEDISNKQTAYNYGMGFRYLIAREYGIRMGIDIARGPEQWAFYLQFGSSWFSY
ncbi:MAG: hypothetical protein MUF28_07200, partial [Ignavibacterium sp.]|nr:hypothetical protein [Ignavibacterium sp.]